jgi:hypothetical protein
VQAAEAVLETDQVFKKIIGGIGYTVTASTPWEDNAGASVLGTQLTLQLDSPLSGTFQLPGVSFPSSVDPSTDPRTYQELMVPLTVTGATTLTVLVDLGAHKVASVQPPQSTLTATPNTPSYSSAQGNGN